MKRCLSLAILALAFCLSALAQDPATTPRNAPSAATPAQQQSNAAGATQDTNGAGGDQITKPAGAKGSTLIGCLVGPDKDGKYTLRNMAHRMGVQVVGPDDLKNDSGSKVKLTGQWQPLPQSDQPAAPPQKPEKSQPPERKPETQRFQATDVEVLAQKCKPPAEATPVSKNKPQKPTTYNAPNSDDSK
ncbi:MAG: hypothetical protein ABSD98_09720 [Candidatus Korobacteraceae bacterium]|jgi:hypothetical protein